MRPFVAALLLCACGEAAPGPAPDPIEAPTRSAAGDLALRRLVMDVAEHRACRALRDRFLPLPEGAPGPGRRARVEGRLWVSECNVTRERDALRVHLAGRGWQWADEVGAGPLGTSFAVRGSVRFEASVDLTSEVDLRYDAPTHRAHLVATPRSPITARVTPVGAVPVAPAGGWSSIVGGLGGLLGVSPQSSARDQLEADAARRLQTQLARGLTLTVDLCTSQIDPLLGALGDGAAPPPPPFVGGRWVDNAEVALHPGAPDVAGPFSTEDGPVTFDVERLDGPAPRAFVVCQRDAAILAAAFLASGEARPPEAVRSATVTGSTSLEVRARECAEPHLVLLPSGEGRARYRVRVEGEAPESLVRCD